MHSHIPTMQDTALHAIASLRSTTLTHLIKIKNAEQRVLFRDVLCIAVVSTEVQWSWAELSSLITQIKAYLLTSSANLQGNSEINFTNQHKDQKSDQKEMQ